MACWLVVCHCNLESAWWGITIGDVLLRRTLLHIMGITYCRKIVCFDFSSRSRMQQWQCLLSSWYLILCSEMFSSPMLSLYFDVFTCFLKFVLDALLNCSSAVNECILLWCPSSVADFYCIYGLSIFFPFLFLLFLRKMCVSCWDAETDLVHCPQYPAVSLTEDLA